MADMTNKNVLKLIATTSSKVRDLIIQDGQLIFIRDLGRIAADFNGRRVFYNQIAELETEAERLNLENPLSGYYFVIDSACLWYYRDGWSQITGQPGEVIFIGTELPTLGQANKMYVDTTDGNEGISVWDDNIGDYKIVADRTHDVSDEDILKLFK